MHHVAQKSTTTTCPGKLFGPSVRPSTDGKTKPVSTLAALTGAPGLRAGSAAGLSGAPFRQLERRQAARAKVRSGLEKRDRVMVIMASLEKGKWPRSERQDREQDAAAGKSRVSYEAASSAA